MIRHRLLLSFLSSFPTAFVIFLLYQLLVNLTTFPYVCVMYFILFTPSIFYYPLPHSCRFRSSSQLIIRFYTRTHVCVYVFRVSFDILGKDFFISCDFHTNGYTFGKNVSPSNHYKYFKANFWYVFYPNGMACSFIKCSYLAMLLTFTKSRKFSESLSTLSPNSSDCLKNALQNFV